MKEINEYAENKPWYSTLDKNSSLFMSNISISDHNPTKSKSGTNSNTHYIDHSDEEIKEQNLISDHSNYLSSQENFEDYFPHEVNDVGNELQASFEKINKDNLNFIYPKEINHIVDFIVNKDLEITNSKLSTEDRRKLFTFLENVIQKFYEIEVIKLHSRKDRNPNFEVKLNQLKNMIQS